MRNTSVLALALMIPFAGSSLANPATPPPAKPIIVQGGLVADTGANPDCMGGPARRPDDPRASGAGNLAALGPKQDDPRASSATGTVALGPKQDDPRAMGASDGPGMAGPRPARMAAAAQCQKQKKGH